MENKQNLHTHTTYADGADSPEALVQEALARGFSGIGFSEHSPNPYSTNPLRMTQEKMAPYVQEIRALKEKYRGKLDIFCGLELEFYSETDTAGLDHLIGAVHYLEQAGRIRTFDVDPSGTDAYIREEFGGDGMAFARKYYETLGRLGEKGVQIIGHFDLLAKHNDRGHWFDEDSKAYRDLAFGAMEALQGKVPYFEVNTGAMSRGYRQTPYPNLELLRELRRRGFGAVITSDCHNKIYLDHGFEAAEILLREAGFSTKWVLTEGGFREVKI